MFRLIPTTPESRDCTRGYKVELDKEYTVAEFIETILANNPEEWGVVRIYSNIGNPLSVNYKHGIIKSNSIPKRYFKKKIKSVKAHGGWSLMDYTIMLKEPENLNTVENKEKQSKCPICGGEMYIAGWNERGSREMEHGITCDKCKITIVGSESKFTLEDAETWMEKLKS